MIKLNKIAMMVATVAVAGAAFANGSTTNSDNWRSGHGNMQWKIGNASALCWRTANWTPATAAPGCDGAIAAVAAAPAPAATVAPVAAAPAQLQPQRLSRAAARQQLQLQALLQLKSLTLLMLSLLLTLQCSKLLAKQNWTIWLAKLKPSTWKLSLLWVTLTLKAMTLLTRSCQFVALKV